MAENALIEKITADAAAEAARIAAAVEEEVAAVDAATERERARLTDRAAAALAKERQHHEVVALSRARQEGNIRLQAAKRAAVDRCFAQVFDELAAQPSERYVAAFSALAKDALPEGVAVTNVLAPAARLEDTRAIMSSLSVSAPIETTDRSVAGLMVYTDDGVYDLTLERLFAEARPRLEPTVIAQILG